MRGRRQDQILVALNVPILVYSFVWLLLASWRGIVSVTDPGIVALFLIFAVAAVGMGLWSWSNRAGDPRPAPLARHTLLGGSVLFAVLAGSERGAGEMVLLALSFALSLARLRRPGLSSGERRLPTGLAELAAAVAGRRRASDAEAWRAHLLGDPDSGRELARGKQLTTALGFLVAAVRMRWHDVCQQLCRPLDWLVTSEARIAKLTFVAGVIAVGELYRRGGAARVWDDFEQVGVLVGLVSGTCYGWRLVRGIKSARRPGDGSISPD